MEDDPLTRLEDIIPKHMLARGKITLDAVLAPIKDLLNRRQFPKKAWSESQVELLLRLLSLMDTDKDPEAARVGEREARIISPLLERLSAGFCHGVGRSGHLTAPQPKAVGASQMQFLANQVALSALKKLGIPNIRAASVLPLSTGMAIALSFAAMRRERGVSRVLYPRIDHTSPKRGIELAGLETIPVNTTLDDDAVIVDMSDLERKMSADGIAVLATTTFFPPRESDPVKEISKMCAEADIPLLINNAYGVQSERVMSSIRSAIDAGRVDIIVQSSDKNFLTPVGGSIIASPDGAIIEQVAETYAGRATAAPIVQTLSAMLLIGLERYTELRDKQKSNLSFLKEQLESIAGKVGQRILDVENPVAIALTLNGLNVTGVGAKLYNQRVTGPRAVRSGDQGSCIDDYPHSYITMNAAIGARRKDIEKATIKLYKVLCS